jgi:predicted metal-dependent hydrolase
MLDVGEDARLDAALAHFNAADFDLAADALEELFFEAVRDEVPFVRALMQIATAMHHVERNQTRAAVERLQEGIRAIDEVTNARGVDFAALRAECVGLVPRIARRERFAWPRVERLRR